MFLQYMISVSEKSAAYSGLHTDSSIDKSKRPQDHSVDSPSDKFPVFAHLQSAAVRFRHLRIALTSG